MNLAKEYRTISNLSGPLMMVEKVEDVSYDELAEIRLSNGERRRGRVLEIAEDKALVQVYEGSTGIDVNTTQIRFLGDVLKLPVSKDMLGRIFNGRGDPIDGGSPIIPETSLDVNGNPIDTDFTRRLIRKRYAAQPDGGSDSASGYSYQRTCQFCRRLRRNGYHI